MNTNIRHYFKHLTCTLFVVLGLMGIFATASQAGWFDTIAPTVSLTSPATGTTFTSAQTVTIAASAADKRGVSKVELYDGTTLKGTDTAAPYSFAWPITSANNGNHSLTAKAYDAAGNSSVSTASNVTINIPVPDLTAPTVSITSPASATTYTSAQTVTMAASASDNVGVSKVEFYDGATLVATDTTAPHSFAWAISSANNGSHSLSAKAYDAVGNVKQSSSIGITVNISAAVLNPGTFQFSASNYSVLENAGKINITINRVGGSSGTASVEWRTQTFDGIGTADWANDYGTFLWTAINFADGETSKVLPITINNDTVVEGDETFSILLQNPTNGATLGTTTRALITIKDDDNIAVDTTAPTVSLSSPANATTYTAAQTVTITASALDNVGVSKVELYDGATLVATDTTSPFSFAWTISIASNGSHSLSAKAYDAAGNIKQSATVAITVNIPTTTLPPTISGPVKAFPGAQGYGTETPGGRGGQIIKVTNLNASGAGSFRAALEASGPRIIVFEVGGTIDWTNSGAYISITNPYVTIAGQTAPFPGINIKGSGIRISTHDVVMQHLRFRIGNEGYTGLRDALMVLGGAYNVVMDHMSVAWQTGEGLSAWMSPKNVTFSNSIVTEGTMGEQHALLLGDLSTNIAVIGNLLSQNKSRNPLVKGGASILFANNVVYNAGGGDPCGVTDDYAHGPSNLSQIGNVYQQGPQTTNAYGTFMIAVNATVKAGTQIYQADNMYRNMSGTSLPMYSSATTQYLVNTSPLSLAGMTILPNSQVQASVVASAGARPAERDATDQRAVNHFLNKTGDYPSSPTWSSYTSTYRAFATPSNPNGDDDGNGYTNIEEILYQFARLVEGR